MPGAPALNTRSTSSATRLARAVGNLAAEALKRELDLTPKPGLVDRNNSGAHRDMDHGTFRASVRAIAPWFPAFFQRGHRHHAVDALAFLPLIRDDGRACEAAMFAATGGVNTHKGSVFSFGLLCAAAGRLHGRHDELEADAVCAEVARICAGLVDRELAATDRNQTAGEKLFRRHGLTGARGEAESGFVTARTYGVAPYRHARSRGLDDEHALQETLLHLMAHNPDTNVVSRGGLGGLDRVQRRARQLLEHPFPTAALRVEQLAAFDQELIACNLSPGGSADLLAVSWFLTNLDGPSEPGRVSTRFDEASNAHLDRAIAAGRGLAL